MDNPDQLRDEILKDVDAADSVDALEDIRVSVLGKKGRITDMMKGLGQMDPDARKAAGQALNALKDEIAGALETKKTQLADADLDRRLMTEKIDVTLPPAPEVQGTIHPISQTIDEITEIFGEMGFTVAEGPDIEDDWHNFTALNIPADHPARQEHDTFYLPGEHGERKVLRTHTSPVQIRTMTAEKPPIRIIVPGRTYRSDYDATHSPMFHQVEGLVIDKTSHMGHLKGCLIEFCRAFFEVDDLPVRFRPSYFPFVEPGAEVDVGCVFCSPDDGTRDSCRVCKSTGWLEVLGCGMIHPDVLKHCGVDSEIYSGFAFGLGVERVAMLRYGIPDIRVLFENDPRFLAQF